MVREDVPAARQCDGPGHALRGVPSEGGQQRSAEHGLKGYGGSAAGAAAQCLWRQSADHVSAATTLFPPYLLTPSVCSGSPRRYLAAVADNCPADQMWCWAQCMDISTLSCASPICTDMHTGLPTDPNSMCMEMGTGKSYCEPQCDPPTNATFDGYCYGNGVSMFMQGFVSIIDKGILPSSHAHLH